MSVHAIFARFLAVLCLSLAPAAGALAQDGPATPPATTSAIDQALRDLIVVLQNDEMRAALLGELERQLETQEPTEDATEEAVETPEPEAMPTTSPSAEIRSLGGRIADFTREAAEDAAASVTQLWRQLGNAPRIFSALRLDNLNTLADIVIDLSALLAITYGGFLTLRHTTRRLRLKFGRAFAEGGWVAKPVAVALGLFADLLTVIVPWAVGYGVALSVLGTPGEITFPHSLYLNAFLMVEASMAVIRMVLSPRDPSRRLIEIGTRAARKVIVWSRLIIGLFVFGQMLILPLFNRTVSFAAGRAISVVLMMALLLLAAVAVLVARKGVSRMLLKAMNSRATRRSLRWLIVYWHIPMLLYLGALAIAALTRSTAAFQDILWANLQIALAILVGLIVSTVLGRAIGRGITLSPHLNARVPLLERQLNAFVPFMLWALRLAVVVGVVVFCLHMLGVIDFAAFLESQVGARMSGAIITVTVMLAIAFTIWLVLNAWVEYRINPDFASTVSSRERTLLVLMRNAVTITLIVITLMFVLSELGINIAPLLASAGVIGLAIGFGAQRLVQDIITGIFIQLEGAIDVGDVVSVGGISGVVERMTIRSVSLRDSEGSYHLVPFSTVAVVTNFMRGFSYAVIDLTVAYKEDTEAVKAAMFEAFEKLKAESSQARFIIGGLDWDGVISFNLTELVVRARIKTLPGKQWGVKRAFTTRVKNAFAVRGIGAPVIAASAPPPPSLPAPRAEEEPAPAQKRKRAKKIDDGTGNKDMELPDPDSGPDSRQ